MSVVYEKSMFPVPFYEDDTVILYHGNALDLLPHITSASIQLIVCDPPYYRVKDSYLGTRIEWDRQWSTPQAYLAWLKQLAKEWQRILTPNGSLYCFASPQMAARIEVMLGEIFGVIQRITWRKPPFATKAEMFPKDELRSFFPVTEAILFCEQQQADAMALGESRYEQAEQSLKIRLFGSLIAEAMHGTGTTAKEVTEAIGAYGKINHGGAVSNWLQGYNIPSEEQYKTMKSYFKRVSGHDQYLRADYEALRADYEALRRPFQLSAKGQYTDVWDFATVPTGKEKHPCQKPLALLRHIIEVSSHPGDIVLDCCAGSFSTLEATKQCGRKGIGIEQEYQWCLIGKEALRQELLFK